MTKRGVKNIHKFQKLDDLIKMTQEVTAPYAPIRDKALLAILILTGCRISEVLSIRKDQFDFEEEADFIMITDIEVLKKRKNFALVDKALALEGKLAVLTEMVMEQYRSLKRKDIKLFNISDRHARKIITKMTGLWPHYFRSQMISRLINEERLRVVEVADDFKVNPATIGHYYKGSWKRHKKAYAPD